MDSTEKIKSRWTRSFFTAVDRITDHEKYICDICHKEQASHSGLALHMNTHKIAREWKCEPCQISFNTQGMLHKHNRSSAHENRVQMTQAFGIPSSENPRPYACTDCDTGFRKHGHLAKHLRSKSHITKLETSGLVPNGTYAALEKNSSEIRDRLVAVDCAQFLNSLRQILPVLFPDGTDIVELNSPLLLPPPQEAPLPLIRTTQPTPSSSSVNGLPVLSHRAQMSSPEPMMSPADLTIGH